MDVRVILTPTPTRSQVYPCRVEDVEAALSAFPEADLEALCWIRFTPAGKRNGANARYFYGRRSGIQIYPYPVSLETKQPRGLSLKELRPCFRRELEYGMEIIEAGSRCVTRWETEALRRFIVEHVLAHEIGHHVHYRSRFLAGYIPRPGRTEAEQFAEAYAVRRRGAVRRAVSW